MRTTVPASATTPPPTSTTPANTAQYAYTWTDINHNVIECERSVVQHYVSIPETICHGSRVTLSVAPSVSVQVGNIKQNVGTCWMNLIDSGNKGRKRDIYR